MIQPHLNRTERAAVSKVVDLLKRGLRAEHIQILATRGEQTMVVWSDRDSTFVGSEVR